MRVVPFVLVLMVLLFGVVAAFETLNSPPEEAAPTPARPTVTPRPRPTSPRPTATVQPTAVPAAQPQATPQAATATPAPQQQAMKVGNTDGQGVYIRRTPNLDDKIRPWMEGTQMMVLGPPQAAGGTSWLKVRAPDGAEGYVPSQYLVPQ